MSDQDPRLPRLYTSRYYHEPRVRQLVYAGTLAAVGITVGAPRAPLGYPLATRIRSLAPDYSFLKDERALFEQKMRMKLQRTWAHVIDRLVQVVELTGADELVLLCFEDITQPGVWCHRQIVAAFIEEQTGQVVEEL
ncbi:MAG: hypothetical protein ACYDA6_03095 [Solirubrobacteraceae bacterium]